MGAPVAYKLCFERSTYRWKAKVIKFPMQLIPPKNSIGIDGNRRNKMTFMSLVRTAGVGHTKTGAPITYRIRFGRSTY